MRYRVYKDGIGIVLEFCLPPGDGVAIGKEGALYDVAHRGAVHRDIVFPDTIAADPLHNRIHEGAVAPLDHDGIPGSFDLSDCFGYCHKTHPNIVSIRKQ